MGGPQHFIIRFYGDGLSLEARRKVGVGVRHPVIRVNVKVRVRVKVRNVQKNGK